MYSVTKTTKKEQGEKRTLTVKRGRHTSFGYVMDDGCVHWWHYTSPKRKF